MRRGVPEKDHVRRETCTAHGGRIARRAHSSGDKRGPYNRWLWGAGRKYLSPRQIVLLNHLTCHCAYGRLWHADDETMNLLIKNVIIQSGSPAVRQSGSPAVRLSSRSFFPCQSSACAPPCAPRCPSLAYLARHRSCAAHACFTRSFRRSPCRRASLFRASCARCCLPPC